MKIIELPVWAKSSQCRPIALYHSPSGELDQLDRPIVLIGGVHGDEPEGVNLAQATLSWLETHYSTSAKDELTSWILIPCLNPDGYEIGSRTNGNGVDLNRNYPSKNWSSQCDEKRYFPGPFGASEPEIQALVNLIERVSPRLLVHFHSWKPCVVCTGAPALKDAHYLAEDSLYEVVEDIGYPTSGSLSQYGWHDHQIPVICIEEAEGIASEKTWQHFGTGIERILKDSSPRRPL